jgi:hypothetical protein
MIHNWETTEWADGIMEEVPVKLMADEPVPAPDRSLN